MYNLILPGLPPGGRAATYDAMNATLAALHNVDCRAVGLDDYDRECGYPSRTQAAGAAGRGRNQWLFGVPVRHVHRV